MNVARFSHLSSAVLGVSSKLVGTLGCRAGVGLLLRWLARVYQRLVNAAELFGLTGLLFLAAVAPAAAQVSPDMATGFTPYQVFHEGDIDSVNLSNLHVIVRIPLISYSQRGALRLGFTALYNVKGTGVIHICPPKQSCTNAWQVETKGWKILDDQTVTPTRKLTFVGVAPNQVPGPDIPSVATWEGTTHPVGLTSGGFAALDGTGWLMPGSTYTHLATTTPCNPGAPCSAMDESGVNHYPLNGVLFENYNNPPGVVRQDTNGNQITYTQPCNGSVCTGGYYTDSLGRQILDPQAGELANDATVNSAGCTGPLPITATQTWTVPGYGGNVSFKFCYATVAVSIPSAYCGALKGVSQNVTELQSIVLPDGETAWTFEYNARNAGDPTTVNYGKLTKITYPTGGSLTYQWAMNCIPQNTGYVLSGAVLSSRALDSNDGTGPQSWTYSSNATSANPINPYTTTVTDPLGNATVHTFTGFPASGNNRLPYETQVQSFSGSSSSGTLMNTVTTDYSANASYQFDFGVLQVFPIRTTTTWAGGLTKKSETDYCCGFTWTYEDGSSTFNAINGLPSDARDYDWGQGAPGALLRESTTAYLAFQSNGQSYQSVNLLDRVSSKVTYDGSANRMAETDYGYDDPNRLASSGISTQHVTPAGVRGNQTSASRWLNTTNSSVTNYTNWFDTGEVYQHVDPLGNTTTHSYDPAYVGGYSTKTCNALSQCVSGTYDFATGLLTSLTNENATTQASGNTPGDSAHTTAYAYDSLDRITSSKAPPDPTNGGAAAQTSFSYSTPNVFPLTVTRTKSITASLTDSLTTTFDGLGRTYKTQHVLPNGTAEVDTTFDGSGRVSSVTNPYFSTSDPTYGVTQTRYDALSRVTQVTKQDSSVVTTQYDQTSSTSTNATCATATDEAAKQRKSCVDGLGRLIEVDEPQASTGSITNSYVTLYSYDALGNLLQVNQKGDGSQAARLRTFTYDSLSRLLTAANPESGTINYGYDANGNVLQKTSPAPNQTGSATETVSYCYDALNRVLAKGYALSPNSPQQCTGNPPSLPNPAVTWAYDSGANGIGRLTSLTDQAGSGVYSYDVMGRIAGESRVIKPGGAFPAVIKSMSYLYNLDGSIQSLTYPSGAVITYTPDAAGRMLSAVDSGNQINYVTGPAGPNPTAGATYGPDGSILSFNQGWTTNFTGIANSFSYNSRLQPVNMAAVSPPSGATASVTIGGTLATAQNATLVNARTNSPIVMAGAGDFYYLDSNGHAREVTLLANAGWANWNNADVTSSGAAAVAGSQLVASTPSGLKYLLYVNTSQHVETVWYDGSKWNQQDLNFNAATNTPLIQTRPGDFYYVDSSGHVHETWLGSGGTWGNSDVTGVVGAPATIAGSQLSGYVNSSGVTSVLQVNSSQHLQELWYDGLGSTAGWHSVDITATTSSANAASSTPLIQTRPGDFYYLDSGGHVHEIWQGPVGTWGNSDVTGVVGAPAAIAGSQLSGYVNSSGVTTVLHVNSSQHLQELWYDGLGSTAGWHSVDITAATGAANTASNTPLIQTRPGDFYYLDSSGHVHETLGAGGAWGDADATAIAGAPAAIAGSQLSGYVNSSGVTWVFYINSSQHLEALWYDVISSGGWHGMDITASTGAGDSGQVSLLVGSFAATACFGPSTNSACAGQPQNYSASQVAATLAQALNVTSSPATAIASGAIINMTWKATGPSTTAVGALSTTHDNPSLFPNPSFTSPATNFSGGSGASLSVLKLNYDFHVANGDNGNVFGITNNKDTTRNQTFTYDALNRLTSAQNAGTDCSVTTLQPPKTKFWGNSYGYDPWGNLLSKTVTKCTAENLSLSVFTNNQLVGYGYDAAGNMTSDPTDGITTTTYDMENRIATVAKNGVATSYTYDANGNRVEKSNGTTGTLYWYMSPGIVAESDLSGNLQSEYAFFDGERVARRDFPGSAVSYYFSDHLKTTDIVTDAQGNIKNESDFYPWGGELQFLNNDSNHYKFTGKERDSETGLDYFGARYYSNGLGRFISADWSATPIPVPYADLTDPQSLNQYSYVRNIPTSNADLDGHQNAQALAQAAPAAATAVAACVTATPCLATAVAIGTVALPAVYAINNMTDDPNLILGAVMPYSPPTDMPAPTNQTLPTTVPAPTSQTLPANGVSAPTSQTLPANGVKAPTSQTLPSNVPAAGMSATSNTGPKPTSLPVEGEAGTTTTRYYPDGSPKQVRAYGPDGKAITDVDFHPSPAGNPHAHDWDHSGDQPVRSGPRPIKETDPKPN
jgi:RHS repeat-associated protein